MKRLVLFLFLAPLFTCAFGQSIVAPNRLWYNFINYYVFPPPVTGVEHLEFTADTVINSLTYKKVIRALEDSPGDWLPYGYIRENTDKQVFYKISVSDPERMLYDLNVSKHDTIYVYGLTTSYTYKNLDSISYYVRSIDSILVDASYRKRINLAIPEDTTFTFEQWVDSIGGLGGMLHNRSLLVGCDYYTLQCYFESTLLKYHDPDYSSCTYISQIGETRASCPVVSVSPNPVTGVSTMEISGISSYSSLTVIFYDLSGKEVCRSTGERRITISSESFPAGTYLYSVFLDKKPMTTGKIVVE
ncbi:MAG: T9SS type A sorting domain-containing protein [Bacteroidetes bacterium]|nr:T9SS type A sorting domain-containing protein [Bacteroidota bacterium]